MSIRQAYQRYSGQAMLEDLKKAAEEAFFAYRDANTGWGVPKNTAFMASTYQGSFANPRLRIEFYWSLVASGFGKKPTQLAYSYDIDPYQSQNICFQIAVNVGNMLAAQCVNSYILWAGTKD